MDEREPSGASAITGDDQRCDLHHLAVATGGRARLLLRGREVTLRRRRVAGFGGHHGQESVRDRVHYRHLAPVR